MDRVYVGAFKAWSDRRQYFVATGEVRKPLKGEWYISGAIPEAWQAPNDLDTEYIMARPIDPPPSTVTFKGFVYKLVGPI